MHNQMIVAIALLFSLLGAAQSFCKDGTDTCHFYLQASSTSTAADGLYLNTYNYTGEYYSYAPILTSRNVSQASTYYYVNATRFLHSYLHRAGGNPRLVADQTNSSSHKPRYVLFTDQGLESFYKYPRLRCLPEQDSQSAAYFLKCRDQRRHTFWTCPTSNKPYLYLGNIRALTRDSCDTIDLKMIDASDTK